jgi:hypothetical protein
MDDRGDLGLVLRKRKLIIPIIQDLLEGQYKSPVRIIGSN